MNKTTEALKLAEEALQTLSFEDEHGFFTAYDVETQVTDLVKPALAAIREVLAEQDHSAASGKPITKPVKQEPVVYYAYATIKEYEELAGFSVSEAFRAGWNMARTTNSMLGINAAPVSAKAIRAETLEEAAKVCRTAQAQGLQSIREAIEEAIRGLK